jgi:D-alanyl-D-alanine dipeptidase
MSRACRVTALCLSLLAFAASPEDSLRAVLADPEYVEIAGIPNVAVDLRYASANNFVGSNVYGKFDRAFLRKPAAEKLRAAAKSLADLQPGWKILVWDALRPRSVQRLFWARVVGTAQQPYVADPEKGSVHNFGFALDVTLLDDSGAPVDMGTGYDDFTKLAEPQREGELLKAGKLTQAQVDNRKILRRVMTGAGFIQQPNEWWHYDAIPAKEARASHPILE